MNLRDELSARFLRDLLPNPAARAFVLRQAEVAESTDEGRFFDLVLAQVDDPELARMVKKHQQDEQRHAEIFHACVERQGVDPGEVPPELRLLDVIDRELDGALQKPIVDRRGVMEAYLILQAVEERALHQFGLLEAAMRRFDVPTADAIRTVISDESRHLKYCRAISRRYAPDALTLAESLGRVRVGEARAFRDHSRRNMLHMLDTGLVDSKWKTAMWRGIAAITQRSNELPFTDFATATELDRAALPLAA